MDELSVAANSKLEVGLAPAVELTSKIVAAYVAKNTIAIDQLSSLIAAVHGALISTETPVASAAEPEKLVPAVPVKKSVTPDYIVCLEDGKKMKMLKRHLHTTFGLSPDEYRTRWGLPPDYPMVAPNYAAHRSALAKSIGLGHRQAPPADPVAGPAVVKKAGRPKKTTA